MQRRKLLIKFASVIKTFNLHIIYYFSLLNNKRITALVDWVGFISFLIFASHLVIRGIAGRKLLKIGIIVATA